MPEISPVLAGFHPHYRGISPPRADGRIPRVRPASAKLPRFAVLLWFRSRMVPGCAKIRETSLQILAPLVPLGGVMASALY